MSKKNKTLVIANDYVEGTVKELVSTGRLRVNGKKVTQPDMSVLHKVGIAVKVGKAERPEKQRGPAPTIYRINTSPQVVVACK